MLHLNCLYYRWSTYVIMKMNLVTQTGIQCQFCHLKCQLVSLWWMGSLPCLSFTIVKEKTFLELSERFCERQNPFWRGCSFKGKNLLIEEQLHIFKSKPPFRREANMKIVELRLTCWVGLTIISNFDSPCYHCWRNPITILLLLRVLHYQSRYYQCLWIFLKNSDDLN